MRTLPANQRAIDAAAYTGDGFKRERIRIDGVDGLILEMSPTGKRVWRAYKTLRVDGGWQKEWLTIGSANTYALSHAKEEARKFMAATKAPEVAPSETFDQLFADHLTLYRKKYRRAWEGDAKLYARHIKGEIGAVMLDKLDTRAIVAALDEIEKRSTPDQARQCHALISATFKWGVGVARCATNPARGIPARKPLTHRTRMFTQAEIKDIWHGSARLGRQAQIVVQLLFLLGLRRSEIAEMERGELDLAKGVFSLRGERRKGWRIGKTPIPHIIPLPPLAHSLLSVALGMARDSKYVFPSRTVSSEGPMSADSVTSAFARLLRTLNIKSGRLHDARRTAKTLMVEAGVPRYHADVVQDHGGLGNAGDIYDASEMLTQKREALETLERELLRIVGNGNAP